MAKFSVFFAIFQKMALKTSDSVRPPKRPFFGPPLEGVQTVLCRASGPGEPPHAQGAFGPRNEEKDSFFQPTRFL